MLAIMVRKFHERNPLKGKALDFENLVSKGNVFVVIKDLDFEMILQERNEKFVYLLEIQF